MMGIIAAIIAAIKGHTTYAVCMGIWTVIAFILIASGSSQYAMAPGGLFVVIAICMKNLRKEQITDTAKDKTITSNNKNSIVSEHNTQLYCKKCGGKIAPEWEFCNNCGYPVSNENTTTESKKTFPEMPDNHTSTSVIAEITSSNSNMIGVQDTLLTSNLPFVCNNCGEKVDPEWQFCNSCGNPINNPARAAGKKAPMSLVENSERDILLKTSNLSDKNIPVEGLKLASLTPKLRRAFRLIEDEEWDKATEYFDKILDEEPENPYAYLGKSMIKARVNSPEDVSTEEICTMCKTRYFVRASKFADGELKQLLDGWKETGEKSLPE